MKDPVELYHFLYQPALLAKSIGLILYEDEKQTGKFQNLHKFIFKVLIANLCIVFLEEFAFIVASIIRRENLVEAITNVSYIAITSGTLLKLFSVLRKKHLLTKLMAEINSMFPTDPKLQKEFEARRFAIRFNVLCFGYVFLNQIVVWWYNLYAVVNYLICDFWLATKTVPLNLPYYAWVPWQWQSHWSYYVLYVTHIVAAYTCMTVLLATDLILCAVAVQTIMHFCYLARRIENYQPTLIPQQDEKFLNDCIKYHQKIIRLSMNMNEVFGVSLLVNFCSSSFITCFLGFLMSIGTQTGILLLQFLFLLSSLLRVSIICHYSQELIVKSENIGHAVYNHNWFAANARYRKLIIAIIQRAQRPTRLNATTFLPVSMGTMADLMRLSYKFFALLRTMYYK